MSEALWCAACGARLEESAAEELRNVIYLLSELKSWEAQGLLALEKAESLRRKYESRRDELRAQLAANGNQAKPSAPHPSSVAPLQLRLRRSLRHQFKAARTNKTATHAARRSLFETLADPYTLRLLLYTGAAMLVVGIVIWLRDVLYLKLQEPLVQAVLLALGTLTIIVCGWAATLRTSLRLTGRALTLAGSLLVPVNFWFLERSGLVEGSGRAWIVCVLCAALYAHTAALLREPLYVYLSAVASIATAWALIHRATPEAYGLYALSSMAASLIFLHLVRAFPRSTRRDSQADATRADAAQTKTGDEAPRVDAARTQTDDEALPASRWAYELWGAPLVRVALLAGSAAASLYMLLRLGSTPAPAADGIFRWLTDDYDASVAMLLFAAGAYGAWYAARYAYTKRNAVLYTTAALALLWTEFLLLDHLRARGQTFLLALSTTALAVSVAARLLTEKALARALHRAADITLALLLLAASGVALLLHLGEDESFAAWRPALLFALAAMVMHGLLRGWRERATQGLGLAALAALVLAATLSDALRAAGIFPQSWPIACGVVLTAYLWQRFFAGWPRLKTKVLTGESGKGAAVVKESSGALSSITLDAPMLLMTDGAVIVCALLWLLTFDVRDAWGASGVMLLAFLFWAGRAWSARRALPVYVACAQGCALLWTLLVALRLAERWFALAFTLLIFPALYALGRTARARGAVWLAQPLEWAGATVAGLIALAVALQAATALEVGNENLLAPAWTACALSIVTFAASLLARGRARVHYFRLGLGMCVAAFILAILRAGFDPVEDAELYTSPVAVVLLITAYLSVRREWDEYARDTSLLLWAGSVLLCGPLLIRALQFRLLLDLPASSRDLAVLCAALVLLLYGAWGRLRAPVITGTITLLVELAALSLTSVEWLQVPVKIYLITAGLTIIIVWGVFEYRREQILRMRRRLNESGARAREQFSRWR